MFSVSYRNGPDMLRRQVLYPPELRAHEELPGMPFGLLTATTGQLRELGRFVGGFRIVMIREMA